MVYGNCVLLLLAAWRKLQKNVNTNWKENIGGYPLYLPYGDNDVFLVKLLLQRLG